MILPSMGAGGGERLAMRLRAKGRQPHVRRPNLDGAQTLRARLRARRLGPGCRVMRIFRDELHVTYD